MFNNYFSNKVPFMRWCGNNSSTPTGHRRQYNKAHLPCMPDKEGQNTDTHPEYAILIVFARASLPLYADTAFFV